MEHMAQLEGLARSAITRYAMLAEGDRVCVGVSGGKDSLALACVLFALRDYCGISFDVFAVTLDPCFGGTRQDYSAVAAFFEKMGLPYLVKPTDIGRVVFDVREEKNPCALCAKMRRGILHDTAKELGCNKVALGHHMDDAVETFYMNLWDGGRLSCFSPVSYLSRKDLTLIRPLALATEGQVAAAAARAGLPVVESACPMNGETRRQDIKDFVSSRAAADPAFRQKTLGAMQKAHLSGW